MQNSQQIMETLISIACTLNTLCSLFQDTLNSFKQRNLDALDYTGVVQKVLKLLEEYVFPILKRLMFFEIILSIYLLLWQTIWIDLVFFSKILLVCFLLLPQIIFITLVFLLELYILVVLCFKRSFNGSLLTKNHKNSSLTDFLFRLFNNYGCFRGNEIPREMRGTWLPRLRPLTLI